MSASPGDEPKKLSIAELIGDKAGAARTVGAIGRKAASTIAEQMQRDTENPLARELRKVGEWRDQIAADSAQTSPYLLSDPNGLEHLSRTNREIRRRAEATAEAERRTVAALETMLQEAQASKADNARMLWWARAAGIAGIIGVVLAIVIPIAQAMWTKTL